MVPILKLEFFFLIIIAIISEPPTEPFLKNIRPYPSPHKAPPYKQYKSISLIFIKDDKGFVIIRETDNDSIPIAEYRVKYRSNFL